MTYTLTTTPHRLDTPRPNVDRATQIRAAQRRLAALRDAGLPTTAAEQALAKLEAQNA